MYDRELLDRNLHPLYRGVLEGATVAEIVQNDSCGDEIVIFLKVEGGVITEGAWEGYGCAISQAAADFLIERVMGRTVGEVAKLRWEEVPELVGVKRMPARVKCAGLAWEVVGRLG